MLLGPKNAAKPRSRTSRPLWCLPLGLSLVAIAASHLPRQRIRDAVNDPSPTSLGVGLPAGAHLLWVVPDHRGGA